MLQPKKRTHSSHVCNFCKRRKVRCDKGTPCSACVKYGNPICEYPPETTTRATERAENDFGEVVLQLDNPVQARPHERPQKRPQKHDSDRKKRSSTSTAASLSTPSSSSSTSSLLNTFGGPHDDAYATDMYSELEFLKTKISMLEDSISGGPATHSHTSSTSNGSGPLPGPLPGPIPGPAPGLGGPIWKNPNSTGPDDMSFMLGNNPHLSDSQYFSFHNSYVPFVSTASSSVRHYYPLNWVSLIKIDSAISPLFAMKQKRLSKTRNVVLTTDTEPSGPSERVFNKKLREFVDEEGAYRVSSPAKDDSKIEKLKKINQRARAVGLTVFEGDLESEHDVLAKATLLLPSRKVIWLLIDRFFDRVYPFFPFLDQTEFEEIVRRILGSACREHVPVEKLQISKKIEVIHLGILLIVLRLAYLTLFTNEDARNEKNLYSTDPSPKAQQLRFLLSNPIDIDVFNVAQLCLFQFGYLRYSNLPILQLCLYLKIYNSFAPENGEGADDSNSQGFCARIIDMAMTLGLHREPDNFRSKVRDEKTNNLCRKIWWYLVIVDVIGGLTNGSPLSIKRSQFDTLPPFHKPGNENIRNAFLESQVVISLARFDMCYDRLYKVVSVISEVRTPIRMKDFCVDITDLENQLPEVLGDIVNALESSNDSVPHIEIANAHLLKIGFQSTFFMVSVNLHFFNYYEKMGQTDLAYYFLKKLLSVSVYRMMPFYDKFVENTADIFQSTTDIAITPSFQTLVHKCTIIIHCVEMRARFSIVKCDLSPTHHQDLVSDPAYKRRYDLLMETFVLCETCLKIFLRSMKKMTSRYYYCWRYVKAQEKLNSIRNGSDYYKTWSGGKESCMSLNDDMLEDLNEILRKSIASVQKNEPESDPVPDLSNAYAHDGPEVNTASPAGAFSADLNDQYSDAMWTQMLSMKPDMGKSGVFSQTPPMSFPLDFLDMGSTQDPGFFPDMNVGGAGFYDSILNDIMTQGGEL